MSNEYTKKMISQMHKQMVEDRLKVIEKRIQYLKSRKLVKADWREDSLLRFELIDARKEKNSLKMELKVYG